MSTLEAIVEELKALPPDRLERAADYIHRLQTVNRVERNALLRSKATSGQQRLDDVYKISQSLQRA